MYPVSMLPEPLLWFEWSPTFCTLMYEGISTISAVKIFTENMWIIIHELCVSVSRNSPLVWLRSHIHHDHFVHVSRSPPLVWMMSHILYTLLLNSLSMFSELLPWPKWSSTSCTFTLQRASQHPPPGHPQTAQPPQLLCHPPPLPQSSSWHSLWTGPWKQPLSFTIKINFSSMK